LDRDWAKSAGATPVADTGATVVLRSLRLGDLRLDDYRTALYPLAGLSEASGRLQQGLLGPDVLHRFAVETDYPPRPVPRLCSAACGSRLRPPGWGARTRAFSDARTSTGSSATPCSRGPA